VFVMSGISSQKCVVLCLYSLEKSTHYAGLKKYDSVSQDLDAQIFFLKKYCGALGGPTSAIFGRDHRDPLKFDANIFLDPSDHPYMSKMSKKSKI